MSNSIIQTHDLRKVFNVQGKFIEAVKGVSLNVEEGEIYGFLGPNGAGKSTTFSILTTLLKPTSGRAIICGYDLIKDSEEVKRSIGYVSQAGGVDGNFSVIDNLKIQGELYSMKNHEIDLVSKQLLKDFDMEGFADRKCETLSGGQQRKVEIAMGIIHNPKILFLDEPTTGLDTYSRIFFWDKIKSLKNQGMTIFFTTHYLEEADNLCDRLSIMNDGNIVCTDNPKNLKKQLGKETITLTFKNDSDAIECSGILKDRPFIKKTNIKGNTLTMFLDTMDNNPLFNIIEIVQKNNFILEKFSQSEPSLDDVFLIYTGKSLFSEK